MGELAGVTVLVAEDNDSLLSLLQTLFETHGASVHAEKSGRDVLAQVKCLRPDIILLDVVMPHVDGLTLLSRLRASGDHTPVIMLTEKMATEDKVTGLDCGADDYVTKPFSTRELVSRIKSVLRRGGIRGEARRQIPAFGNVQINSQAREVLVDGTAVRLTKTEFELFCYLVERKSMVAPHGDLLNEVLGYRNPVETKALVMHIANIRKKMANAGMAGGRIETVSGVGYILREEA